MWSGVKSLIIPDTINIENSFKELTPESLIDTIKKYHSGGYDNNGNCETWWVRIKGINC